MADAAYPPVSESDWLASTTSSAQSKPPPSSSSSSQSARVPRSPYSSAPQQQQQRTASTDSSNAPLQSPPNSASRLYFPTAAVPSRTSSAASNQSSAYSSAEYPTRGASLGAAAARDPSPSLPPRDHDQLVRSATTSDSNEPNAVTTTTSPPLSMPTPIPIPVPEMPSEAPYGALPLSNTDSSAYSVDMTGSPPPPASSGIGLGFDSPQPSLGGAEATPDLNAVGGGGTDPPPALPPRHRESSPRGGQDGAPSPATSAAPELPPRQPSSLSIQSRTGGVDTVPTGFDEGALRALCDMDVRCTPFSLCSFCGSDSDHLTRASERLQCGTPLLLDRMKQSMTSCRVSFLAVAFPANRDYF